MPVSSTVGFPRTGCSIDARSASAGRVGEHQDRFLQKRAVVAGEQPDDFVHRRGLREHVLDEVASVVRKGHVGPDERHGEPVEPQAVVIHPTLRPKIIEPDHQPAVRSRRRWNELDLRARVVPVFVVAHQDRAIFRGGAEGGTGRQRGLGRSCYETDDNDRDGGSKDAVHEVADDDHM
jgi:hypothetical protein